MEICSYIYSEANFFFFLEALLSHFPSFDFLIELVQKCYYKLYKISKGGEDLVVMGRM